MPRRLLGLSLALLLVIAAAPACGEDDGVQESRIIGDTLTIFSSLPQQGPLAQVSRDVVAAEKLALKEAGGRAGVYDVSYVSLNSADPETGRWEPGRVAANARRAVQTPNTIAYLGELEPGASAISLPILNEGGILQVSPRDTFSGLTEAAGRGEPEKYYPSGVRSFARVVPPGVRQVDDIVAAMVAQGVERVTLADDRRLNGTTITDGVAAAAEEEGIEVVDRRRLDADGEVPEGLGDELVAGGTDGVFYGGAYGEFAVDLLREIHDADEDVRIFGADELTVAPGLPVRAGAAARRMTLTGVDPGEDADFERRFVAEYGREPDRQAVLGYRAMRLVLDAIRQAGPEADSRREVIRRAVALAQTPRAGLTRYRIRDARLVSVASPM